MSEPLGAIPVSSHWSIGVDFGTAFSKAAATRIVAHDSVLLREVRPLRIGDHAGWERPFLVPSAMFLDRARVHFGPSASARLITANFEERELVRSFKTVLGANDFENALDLFPRATVDPDRLFRLRDLIVLYLAYLLALVNGAVESAFDGADAPSQSRLRFTRPGWIPDRIAAAHEVMSTVFSRAHLVYQSLGDSLLDPAGVEYGRARQALDGAFQDNTDYASLDGGIYEASAVGLCHYSDPTSPNCLLIVDIGAGTTDIAGLLRAPLGGEIRVVRTGRRTIEVAGDHFDAALADLLVSKSRLKQGADRKALWRTVLPQLRDLKEEIFSKGAIEVAFRNRKITVSARELERWPTFRAAVSEIEALFQVCLRELLEAARREGVREIGIVLAGGGAHLPALKAAISAGKSKRSTLRVFDLPTVPAWVHELNSADEFAILFSQLSAAFGAAISVRATPSHGTSANEARTLSA